MLLHYQWKSELCDSQQPREDWDCSDAVAASETDFRLLCDTLCICVYLSRLSLETQHSVEKLPSAETALPKI